MIKSIKIFSQNEAKYRIPNMGDVSLISIVDKNEELLEWSDNVVDIFTMKFDDTDDSLKDASPNKRAFKGLKNFVDNLKTEVLIVHCYAGISRSSAVAAAIGEYLGIRLKIWTDRHYDPNILVYELTKEELFG